MQLRPWTYALLLIVLCSSCFWNKSFDDAVPLPFMEVNDTLIDSLLERMTLEEKLGQLLILQTNTTASCTEDSLYNIIKNGYTGGLILENQSLEEYIRITKNCQQFATSPLLLGTRQRVSLSNQFVDTPHFPSPASLSAVDNDSLLTTLQSLFVEQCKAMGIHFCYVPTQDTKDYHQHTFYLPETQQLQYTKSLMQQLQTAQILAIGDAFSDLHYLPQDTLGLLGELLHFPQQLTQSGLAAWQLDEGIFTQDTMQFVTPAFAQDYMYQQLGFGGLLLGKVNANAPIEHLLHAGVEVFIVDGNIKIAHQKLRQLALSGLLSQKNIDRRVAKILKAKRWIFEKNPPSPSFNEDAVARLFQNKKLEYLRHKIHQDAVVFVQNAQMLPFNYVYKRDFQIIQVEEQQYPHLVASMQQYGHTQTRTIAWTADKKLVQKNRAARLLFKKKPTHQLNALTDGIGTKILVLNQDLDTINDAPLIEAIRHLSQTSKLVLINFGNPYNLGFFDDRVTMIHAFENNAITQKYIGELLFGGRNAKGKLPLSINSNLQQGKHVQTPITRLNYAPAWEKNIAPEKLVGIDAIVQRAIRKKAIPGAQVLVAYKGSIVYHKAFGYHTYAKEQAVRLSDMYDLASLTKTTATTLAAMKLHESGKFDLDAPLSTFFDLHPRSRYGRITLGKLLQHKSRLQANMPVSSFIKMDLEDEESCNEYFCTAPRLEYRQQIADRLYLGEHVKTQLLEKTLKLRPNKSHRYRYSDVNFNLIQAVIEQTSQQGLDDYLNQHFYRSLNMERCLYNPRQQFEKTELVPTAFDHRWRKQTLQGFVHDESAALLGGVAGNAGLFSNAADLAVLYQMLLNGGSYGNQQYLKTSTIDLFTNRQRGTRRGLGFDKPRHTTYPSYSKYASSQTYGHTGFTGTAVWVDPKADLIYIFLSNRVHPKPNNQRLFKEKTRRRIHDVVYRALGSLEDIE